MGDRVADKDGRKITAGCLLAIGASASCYHIVMATRTTFTLDESVAEQAREVRSLVTVAEITSTRRGLAAQVVSLEGKGVL